MPETMFIGELANRAGVRPSAIRYYEARGLLPPTERLSGRRCYSPDTLRTLSIIGAAQRAGLSLDEIRELLSSNHAEPVSDRLRAIAEHKLPEVDALIERARLVKTWLQAAAECRCPSLEDCPLFDPVAARIEIASD